MSDPSPPKKQTREESRRDVREMRTSASPQDVWDAWADPEKLAQWFPDEASGEATPGKQIIHVWRRMGFEIAYEVLEAEPGSYLLVEGRSPFGFPFREEIVIERQGGETVMRLIHSGFGEDSDWGDEYEGIDSGWKLALAILQHYLENHFGQRRGIFMVMRPASFSFAELQNFYRRREGLARWLTRSGELAGTEVGEKVHLVLRDGTSLTGRLLADSGRELALSWKEINGAIELKGIAMPQFQAVCLRGSAWGAAAGQSAIIETGLEGAAERLVAALAEGASFRS